MLRPFMCEGEVEVHADIAQMALYAGQSCSLIDSVKSAAEIVANIVRDAAEIVNRLSASA